MNKVKIYTENAPANPPTISHGVRFGDTIIISGQVGKTPDGFIPETVEEQVHQAFSNLKAILAADGKDLNSVVFCQCYLTDQKYFAGMNKVYHSYFEGMEVPPARCTVFAGLANPKLYFEIVAFASANI